MKFVNPYNFIPFNQEIDIQKSRCTRTEKYRGEDELLSGWLDVSLYTKTPLIIPNGAYPTVDKEDKDHKIYKFFKYGEDYAVPGSEIRGMIRSVYESVTNSCVRELMDDKPISQRVPTFSAVQKRGLLTKEEGGWVLYATEKEKVKVFEPSDKDKAIQMKKEIQNWKDSTGTKLKDGYYLQYNIPVVLSAEQPYTIYKIKPSGDPIYQWNASEEDDDSPYKKLKSALHRDGVKGNQKNPNEKCQKALLQALEDAKDGKNQMVPVFYFIVMDEDKKIVYLSGSSIGRIAHRRKWKDVMGNYAPCSEGKLCPACLLFGTIKGTGLKTHVRFMDALNEDKTIKSEYHTLQILGEPRISAFDFYFQKPQNAKFWNIDFYSYTKVEGKNATVVFEHLKNSMPRGRKMYWHSQPAPDAIKSHLNSTMESVKANTPFKFRIHFDQITSEQLQDLEWVISLGDNQVESNLQHKLGHAKPLGYGSVKLVIDKVTTRKITKNEEQLKYNLVTSDLPKKISPGSINLGSMQVKSLLAMANVDITTEKSVEYPNNKNKGGQVAIFNWFAENRKNANELKTLPEPTNENIELNNNLDSSAYSLENQKSNTGKTSQSAHVIRNNTDLVRIVLTKVDPNYKDPKTNVGYHKNGIVFNVPNDCKKGDTIMAKPLKNPRHSKYVSKV